MTSNEQLKKFVDGVFYKHALSYQDTMTIGELYEFFCNFFSGKGISLNDVQKTLHAVKTESSELITKREMYIILKTLVGKKREGLKDKPNSNITLEDFAKKANKEKSKPKKDKENNPAMDKNLGKGAPPRA